MKTVRIILLVSLAFLLSKSIIAQEKTKQQFELPKYTLEQKYKRAEGNLITHYIVGISFAKSKGFTPEEYGKFVGDRYGQFWQVGERNPIEAFVSGMNYNMNSLQNFQMEILDVSDSVIKAKMNRKWEDRIKTRVKYGTTVNEFHNWLENLWKAIANHLGLEYNQKFEGNG